MAEEVHKKGAMEAEAQLRRRRPTRSSPRKGPYFSNAEASEKYIQAAKHWEVYARSLRPNDPDYREMEQFQENVIHDLELAKKLAYQKQEKAQIDSMIDEYKSKYMTNENNGNSTARSLESRAFAYLAIISLASALLTVSLKLTGSVVGASSSKNIWIGLCLFFVGCIFTFFYFRAKKK